MMRKYRPNQSEREGIGFWLLNPKTRTSLFFLLILLLPTQLGLHFWPEFSILSGLRVDYLSPTFYVTDGIAVILIGVFSVANYGHYTKFQSITRKKKRMLALAVVTFVLVIATGVVFSYNIANGVMGVLKTLELGFVGFLASRIITKKTLSLVLIAFVIGVFFESLLAIAQYVDQQSLQGIFYFFGERAFSSQTPGIANAVIHGSLILRPYGTFSHPNVLAGYLVLSLIMLLVFRPFLPARPPLFFLISSFLGSIALLLTLSRVAILVWVCFLGVVLIKNLIAKTGRTYVRKHAKQVTIIGFIALLTLFLFSPTLFARYLDLSLIDETLTLRLSLLRDALALFHDSPLFGVGLKNFLPALTQLRSIQSMSSLQPVHNIFVLLFVEVGILGSLFVLLFLRKTYYYLKKAKTTYHVRVMFLLFIVCLLGFFDHYFLTLQQGQLLLAVLLGMAWVPRLRFSPTRLRKII